MQEENKDALDVLFVQESEISGEVLRDLLVKYVQLSGDGKIFTKPEFTSLQAKKQIMVILLSKKVLKMKMNIEEETAGVEIMSATGMARGTVYPYLRELERERLIVSKDGKYWVPSYSIGNVKQLFNK